MVLFSTNEDLHKFEGYCDDIATILAAHEHPIIVVEETALRWMGQRVSSQAVISSFCVLIRI